MKLREGDILEVIWADFEIQTGTSAKDIKKQTPCFLASYGRFVGESDDEVYYIIAHNSCRDKVKGCYDNNHNDHTRILKSGIAKITKLKPATRKKR